MTMLSMIANAALSLLLLGLALAVVGAVGGGLLMFFAHLACEELRLPR